MVRSRRVALIVPFFGAELAGVPERRAYEVASVLADRGSDIEVLTTCARSPAEDWSSNYYRPGIDESEPFRVHRFAVEPRDRAAYERAESVFEMLAERENWMREPPSREEEIAIVRHGVVSGELVQHLRANVAAYDAFLFLSYRDSLVHAALPSVAERAVLLPFLRREPFAATDAVRGCIRRTRALAFASEDEYAIAIALYGPSIAVKSQVIGPIARAAENRTSIDRIAGFDLRRERYVAAFADDVHPRALQPLLAAYGAYRARDAARLRLVVGGTLLPHSLEGVRALAALSSAERDALLASSAAVVHVDRDDPVAQAPIGALASGVPAVVGVQTPILAKAVAQSGAGWVVDGAPELDAALAEIAASSKAALTACGAHGREAFGRLGGGGWPKRLEAIVDGIHAIEDGRTREEALSQVAFLYPLVRRMRADIVAMQNSRFWRLRDTWFALKERLGIGSADTLRSYAADTDPIALQGFGDPYFIWIQQHGLRDEDRERMAAMQRLLPLRLCFELLLTVGSDAAARELEMALRSMLDQLYAHWRLRVDVAGDRADLVQIAERYAARDERITLAGAADWSAAGGDFVGGFDARDVLAPDALFEAALALNHDDAIDALYADFDTIDDRGYRSEPFFKPDWSPETLLGRNLFTGFALLRGRLFEDVGGLREGTAGAQWYDAALRLTEHTDRVAHVPRMLYHRRRDAARLARAAEAELNAVRDAIRRRGAVADVAPLPSAGIPCRLVRYAPRGTPRVTIVVPTRDKPDLLDRCLVSIFERSTYANFDVLVVDNGSVERATHDVFRRWQQREPARIRVERDASPFNFAVLNNRAVTLTDAEYVVFLNNDTVAVTEDWIESMLGYAQLPHIGAVGALLMYPDDTVQHSGVVLAILGLAGHAHRHLRADSPGYYGALQTVTNYSAVTGACMMVERARFLDAGGFDEAFAVAWNDVDLCLRLVAKGYRNVYVPHARLYHFESKTRGGDDTPSKVARAMSELFAMRERWPAYTQRDPYYSPWLTTDAEDFGIHL